MSSYKISHQFLLGLIGVVAIFAIASLVIGIIALTKEMDDEDEYSSILSWKPTNVYAFGDSSNDPGNLFILDPEAATGEHDATFNVPDPLGVIVPVISKQRFGQYHTNCNYLLANEYLANSLRMKYLKGYASNTLPSSQNIFIDFSISGAQQGSSGYLLDPSIPSEVPSVESQIDRFVTLFNQRGRDFHHRDVILIRAVGGNEFPWMAQAAVDGADPAVMIQNYINRVVTNISKLYAVGARNFVLEGFNEASTLLITKKIIAVNPDLANSLLPLANDSWDGVKQTIDAQKDTLWPSINMTMKNQSFFRNWLTENASQVGIIDDDVSMNDQIDDNLPVNPRQRFWDDIHNSSAVHELWSYFLGTYLFESISQVSTP